jgi:hypothetical protein
MIIIANRSAIVGMSTSLPKSSTVIAPLANSAMTASSAIPVRSTCSHVIRSAAMPT